MFKKMFRTAASSDGLGLASCAIEQGSPGRVEMIRGTRGNFNVKNALISWVIVFLPSFHGGNMEEHVLTTHRRCFKPERLQSFISNTVTALCRAVF